MAIQARPKKATKKTTPNLQVDRSGLQLHINVHSLDEFSNGLQRVKFSYAAEAGQDLQTRQLKLNEPDADRPEIHAVRQRSMKALAALGAEIGDNYWDMKDAGTVPALPRLRATFTVDDDTGEPYLAKAELA